MHAITDGIDCDSDRFFGDRDCNGGGSRITGVCVNVKQSVGFIMLM